MSEISYKLVKAKHGRFLANPQDVYIGTAIIAYGEFSEIETNMLLRLCGSGATVVEVGANIGTHTVPLARHVGPRGRVCAFEPQPVIFQNLCANIALNGFGNVETLQKACGVERSEAWMPRLNYAVRNNFGGISVEKSCPEDKPHIKVDVLPLDGLSLEKLDLLKIDAEGMELDVLQGAVQTISGNRPAIYLENDRLEKSPNLIEFLSNLNYRMWWHTPPLYNPKNWNKNSQNIWPGTVSVNMLCIPGENDVEITQLKQVSGKNDFPLRQPR